MEEMKKFILTLLMPILALACNLASPPTVSPAPVTEEFIQPATFTPIPATLTPLPPTETFTPIPTATITPIPFVDEIKATVTADTLVCRYGPGANYLYLFAFVKGANIKLIGRTEGKNDWVLVENDPQRCWINSKFVAAEADVQTLKPVYPDEFKLIVSPYYGPSQVLTAERKGEEITVTWMEVLVSPGKYENENMFPYLVEVWRCENGEIIFETLGSRFPFITFVDQAGCSEPSRGRVFVQEKHGYAGPADIPWPAP